LRRRRWTRRSVMGWGGRIGSGFVWPIIFALPPQGRGGGRLQGMHELCGLALVGHDLSDVVIDGL